MNEATTLIVAPSWESHLETLHRQLSESAPNQCLLWINPAQGDPFGESPLVEERKVPVPIFHTRFDVQFAPYLVPLDLLKSADADLFTSSVEMAWAAWEPESLSARCGQPVAGWVVTNDTPKALARYWATHCHIHVNNGLSKLLRFHDPGVREWLWPTLSSIQRLQLLGPALSLTAFNRQQDFVRQTAAHIEGTLKTHQSAENATSAKKLTLTPAQWDQVDDYAIVHAAWIGWRAQQAAACASVAQKTSWEQDIFAALRQATHYGIHDPEDRELFALHALQIGGSFHMHEKMKAVWNKTRAGDFYGGALEVVSGCPANQLQAYLHRT